MKRLFIEIVNDEHTKTVEEQLDEWVANGWIRHAEAGTEDAAGSAPRYQSAKEAEQRQTMTLEEVKSRLGLPD